MANRTVENKTMVQEFYTLVRHDNEKFGNNKFVLGKIVAYKELLCDNRIPREDGKRRGFATRRCKNDDRVLKTICTPEHYDEFAKLVEYHYPGLCEFNCGETGYIKGKN